MFSKIKFWLECSRWYTLPMTVFSWLIIFLYCLKNNGNVFYGLLALVGICLGHLATNLFDDFCDFHKLQKCVDMNNKVTLPNTQRGKCRYLLEDKTTLLNVLKMVGIYLFFAMLIGVFFYFAVGKEVLYFVLGAGMIVLFYSFLSEICLSELAVGLAFGPLLFGGTYYVMMSKLTVEPFILAIPSMIFTINLIYTDTFIDKNIDKKERKKTLVSCFSDDKALSFQKKLLFVGYLSVLLVPMFDISDWEVFFIYLTIPLAVDLIKSLKMYSVDSNSVPQKKWFHVPFEAWEDIAENRSMPFMFRMYQARNLMIYVAILLSVSIIVN